MLTQKDISDLKETVKKHIKEELEVTYASEEVEVNAEKELAAVYHEVENEVTQPGTTSREMRYIDAVSDGLREGMQKWDNLILMGQDIADYGGVFKITEGFTEAFGRERVRNTPLCESAIVGIGLGLSMKGYKSMVEMQFADFVTCGFNQIVNNLAKIHYRWGHAADVVIRMPCGGGVGAGPFHSQTNEAWFTHTPGLKVVYPSTATDAKGLLLAALEDKNPVMFFEHKGLYRTHTEAVPEGYYTIEIGKGRRVQSGDDLSIITYGMGVHWATAAAEELGVSADVIDLRSLVPLDYGIINDSIMKTNRAVILHEDALYGGLGGEISSYISEHLFEHLDAPIVRVGSLDMPIPFHKELEKVYLASNKLNEAITRTLEY